MRFSDMISVINDEIIVKKLLNDFEVNKLSYNSSKVSSNDIFFAVRGLKYDGNIFISDAVDKGASAVVTESDVKFSNVSYLKVRDCRKSMALLANMYFDHPSLKMKMIGVTGTNGKTTITNIINYVLSFYGKRTGLIGTNGNFINGRKFYTEYTTPESVELNELLSSMQKEKVEYVIMEASSHSLALKRVYGIDFDAAVFTNLTPEHLDFHKDMEGYFNAKKILFDSLTGINKKGNKTFAVYNIDDEFGSKIVKDTYASKLSYGLTDGDYRIKDLKMNFEGMKFKMIIPEHNSMPEINTKLTGKFNTYNIIAATAVLRSLNIPDEVTVRAISEFEPVDGRFNSIILKNGAIAIIDYSHTSDSLKKALTAIKEIKDSLGKPGRILTVFGCGGDRDRTKRPVMGSIASENSDEVIVTSDNPRSEEPMDIINEILQGIKKDNYITEPDRKIAIEKAYNMSRENDVILIAGKGHETYQEIKGVRYQLSDKEIISQFA